MNFSRVFLIPGLRERYCKIRFKLFVKFFGLRTFNNNFEVSRLDYSKSHFKKYLSIRERIDFLVNYLGSTTRDTNKKILVLGPRYESELFGYQALGFRKKNIYALDTYSYSKKIITGNIHNLPFSDEFFDIIVCGWTLPYSNNIELAIDEISRSLKKGGIFICSFDIATNSISKSLIEIKISENHESNFLSLLRDRFKVLSYYVGTASWTKGSNIFCAAMEKK